MKSDSKLNALGIYLHGRRVGIINRLTGDRHIFSFEQDYIDHPDRATLSLSFKGRTGGLVTALRPVGRRLPPFFSNLLPEGRLREYLAEQAGVKPVREFFLLAVLGADLPGALTAAPLSSGDGADGHTSQVEQASVPDDRVLRFSLAGVQLKFSAIMEASGGFTLPAHGIGGSWIVKLPSMRFASVPENEFVMLELARAVGISVPKTRLVPVPEIHGLPAEAARMEGKALVVRRFDRGPDGLAIHMEDFAQVFGVFPDDKYGYRSYANIASVLWAEAGEESTYEFVRRLVFSVLIGNGDMHLKNWSLLYPDRRAPVLSPAYDFVATLPYLPEDKLGLNFGGSRDLDSITPDRIRRFVDTARLPANSVWSVVRETLDRTASAWRTLGYKDLLPTPMMQAIGDHIHTVLANSDV
jgi:serine/threonine-protein kinase HipA